MASGACSPLLQEYVIATLRQQDLDLSVHLFSGPFGVNVTHSTRRVYLAEHSDSYVGGSTSNSAPLFLDVRNTGRLLHPGYVVVACMFSCSSTVRPLVGDCNLWWEVPTLPGAWFVAFSCPATTYRRAGPIPGRLGHCRRRNCGRQRRPVANVDAQPGQLVCLDLCVACRSRWNTPPGKEKIVVALLAHAAHRVAAWHFAWRCEGATVSSARCRGEGMAKRCNYFRSA